MLTMNLLTLLFGLPLLGALVIGITPNVDDDRTVNLKYVSLWTSLTTLVLAGYIFLALVGVFSHTHFQEIWHIPLLSASFAIKVDGLSMAFILLTTLLTVLSFLISWKSITRRVKHYLLCFLILEASLIGVFIAWDLLLFFIFFEFILIPMFFLVGIWGGKERLYAALKFFLYTFSGSLFMLIALIYVYQQVGSFNLDKIWAHVFSAEEQFWLALGFCVAFAVKMPMVPVHTWLPDTHVQAPTAGSVMLAGILLKLGGYGLIRFVLPVFPLGVDALQPFVFALSVFAIIYGSIVAFAQQDVKKLVAYSSIAHMGIVTLGLFLKGEMGIQGAVFQMISHGLISAGLFLAIGVIYERMHTRDRDAFGGVVLSMPIYATVFMVLTLGALGLPGTTGFVGELMVVLALFKVSPFYAALAATGALCSAVYSLWLYRKISFGEPASSKIMELVDLNGRERLIFIPLLFAVIVLGICPAPLLKLTRPAVEQVRRQADLHALSNISSKRDFKNMMLSREARP